MLMRGLLFCTVLTLFLKLHVYGQCLNSTLNWNFVQRSVVQNSPPSWIENNSKLRFNASGQSVGFGGNGDTFLFYYFVS